MYLYAPSREEAEAIAKPVFEEIDRVDGLLSHYRPDSELSRINHEAFDARGDDRSGNFPLSGNLPGVE